MADQATTQLPAWRDVASTGNLVPTVPPVFDRSDLVWVRGRLVPINGIPTYLPGQAGAWSLNLYGVPEANVPWYGNDPNTLYQFGTGEAWPETFYFGIKSGRDQGYVYRYDYNPELGKFLPTGTSGLIGGRNSLFDTNAFIRTSNRMLAIIVVAIVGGAYLAIAAEGAAAAGGAAGAAGGGAGEAGISAGALETASAADFAGGLVPAYGSSAAYDAAIAAGAGEAAAQGAATAGAWDKLIDAAIGQGTKFASSALVSTIAKKTQPGKTPASSIQVAGSYPLPDGSTAIVNPDGSITVTGPGGTQTIGRGGGVSSQWFPGVSNATVFLLGIGLAATLLRNLRRA